MVNDQATRGVLVSVVLVVARTYLACQYVICMQGVDETYGLVQRLLPQSDFYLRFCGSDKHIWTPACRTSGMLESHLGLHSGEAVFQVDSLMTPVEFAPASYCPEGSPQQRDDCVHW